MRSVATLTLAVTIMALAGPVAGPGALPTGGTTAASQWSAVSVDPRVEVAVVAPGSSVGVVVEAGTGATAAARDAVLAAGGTVTLDLPLIGGFAATIGADALAGLKRVPGVRAVTLDGAVALAHTPPPGEKDGDSFFPRTVGADVLAGQGIDGSGVGIAVLDTGVTEVADLAGRVVGAVDLTADRDDVDHYGHGTFIAGLAAGDGTASNGRHAGIAPGAHVVPIKIAGSNGASDISHVLAGIQYAVSFRDAYDIGVLNLSVGTDSTQPNLLSPLNYAVERAWDAGLVVVVSAGNWGPEAGRIPKPADDPLVITVGALDSNGTPALSDDAVPAFSSRGPSIADGIVKPDLVAPGAHLVGTRSPGSTVAATHPEALIGDAYMRGSGTSFSAAVVSGAVALLRQAHPDWTPDEIKGALLGTARPGPVGDPNVDGHGLVDVAAASAVVSPEPANQGVVRSSGLGTLDADRGSLATTIEVPGLLGLITKLLTGELTAQDLLFSTLEYTTTDWTASNWYASNWYASNWYASNWYASNWYASNWYASNWYASNWY